MLIKKFKAEKSNKYSLFVDDTKVILYDDIILKYGLILNKNITKQELDSIIEENNKLSSYYKALKYISIRQRSEKELNYYLKKYNYDAKTIEKTVNRLKKEGYLNRQSYIKSYINDQLLLSNNGPLKILKSLITQGFLEEEINEYLLEINENDWISKVKKIVSKKIKLNKDNLFNFKVKTTIYLQNLGYSNKIIDEELKNVKINNESIINKDYNIIFNKLSKKYSGSKLNYYLKQKLYQKGYSLEEINNIISE